MALRLEERNPLNGLFSAVHLLTVLLVLTFSESRAAPVLFRALHTKPARTVLGPMDDPRIVIFKLKEGVSFQEDVSFPQKDSRFLREETSSAQNHRPAYLSLALKERDQIDRVFRSFSIEENFVRPLFDSPGENNRDKDYAQRQKQSGRALADLSFYHQIKTPQGTDSARLCDALNALSFVEAAFPSIKPAPPPQFHRPAGGGDRAFAFSAPSSQFRKPANLTRAGPSLRDPVSEFQESSGLTPDLTSYQFHLDAPELGAGAVRSLPGADGSGVSVVDVEYEWNFNHEDLGLSADSLIYANKDFSYDYDVDHGTAVLGIIGAKDNGYGVTGLSPGAKLMLAPVTASDNVYNPARSIHAAARLLSPGDIILIQQQISVCGKDYGPLEFFPPVFDAVSSAVSAGITVIAAAGNGGVYLDDPSCRGRFDRNVRDSGAIIVGAGDPANLRRMRFSSYGGRVDVQGFGRDIATTGYGDLFYSYNRKYTWGMGGTSAAAALVAGAAAVVQGVLKAAGREPLRSEDLRSLFTNTGSWPKNKDQEDLIGPLPNLPAIASFLGFKTSNTYTVPLFFSAETLRLKSFVRISNLSGEDGEIFISAFDKNGEGFGPFPYFLPAGETALFRSKDLQAETGKREAGTYRLTLTSALPLEVRAYAQSSDGFYAGMNETVPYSRRTRGFHIKIFEPPGEQSAQKSFLYLANESDKSAQIEIRVTDDLGPVFGKFPAPFSVPASGSLMLSAKDIQEFYTGSPEPEVRNRWFFEEEINRENSFGGDQSDGIPRRQADNRIFQGLELPSFKMNDPRIRSRTSGKWRLSVSSDSPIHVMSIMLDSSSGHISNLSH